MLFYVKRLRTVEGRPFSVVENYLPYDVGMRIPLVRIEDEPLMSLIEKYTADTHRLGLLRSSRQYRPTRSLPGSWRLTRWLPS